MNDYKRIQAAARKYRDREDIAQQAFEIWLRRSTAAQKEGRTISFNPDGLCKDALREFTGQRNDPLPIVVSIDSVQEPAAEPPRECANQRLDGMPKSCRRAYSLVYKKELTRRDAAKRLGITEVTLRKKLLIAERWLKRRRYKKHNYVKILKQQGIEYGHPDYDRLYARMRREGNIEAERERTRVASKKYRDRLKASGKTHWMRYHEKNKENPAYKRFLMLKYKRRYNSDRRQEWIQQYKAKNRQRLAEYWREYRKKNKARLSETAKIRRNRKNGKNKVTETFKPESLETIELRYIYKTLEHHGFNRRKTARSLGISDRTMRAKLHLLRHHGYVILESQRSHRGPLFPQGEQNEKRT